MHTAGAMHWRARACENTIKAAPGKNTNLNGTKEICSHIRCIRMNGARLLQFTIYCFATFFSADASGIRFSPAGSPLIPILFALSPLSLSLSLSPMSLSRSSHRIRARRDKERKRERERERASENGRTGITQSRTIREVKPLLPKRIMRGKIKFFSTRPFELHRPRDHALLLLVLYTVYTFRGMRLFPPSSRVVTLAK